MIEEYVNKKLTQRNAANQHLLEMLGVTMENLEGHEISVNPEGEIVRVQRVMKATIWRKNKMLIEKLKEKLREITEPSLKLNAIKAYLSKHLESFVEAMIVTGASNAMRKIDETYKYNSNGYQFEISVKFEKDVGFKK
ncbi:hypothetical protein UFOVP457_13 [uncultured Caudovirales phage]|uniref:Uncharacterized protein n=1 Tax=uncultured Caudovirales phage TaxID=2100421 RepID=A0A6J5MDE1_9CAUD|nr:hypothetical protein UFOVP457_13 [uncultured Caudovirales phage]